MTEALIVSIFFCIYFIYKWTSEEIKHKKELFNFASALLTANCVLDSLLEYKMSQEGTVVLSFELEAMKNPEKFSKEYNDKYDITVLDDKIIFHNSKKDL